MHDDTTPDRPDRIAARTGRQIDNTAVALAVAIVLAIVFGGVGTLFAVLR